MANGQQGRDPRELKAAVASFKKWIVGAASCNQADGWPCPDCVERLAVDLGINEDHRESLSFLAGFMRHYETQVV